MAVSCRGGEFASRSVCMATTLQGSLVLRSVCGSQLSCTVSKRLIIIIIIIISQYLYATLIFRREFVHRISEG